MKKTKKIIIGIFIITLFLITVGYSAFATDYQISGIAEIKGKWDVKIIDVQVDEMDEDCKNDSFCNPGTPTFSDVHVEFNAQLNKPGNYIVYKVFIKNSGTIEAKLDKVTFDIERDTNNEPIYYSVTSPAEILKPNETTSFIIRVDYDKDVTEVTEFTSKTITGDIKYVQN